MEDPGVTGAVPVRKRPRKPSKDKVLSRSQHLHLGVVPVRPLGPCAFFKSYVVPFQLSPAQKHGTKPEFLNRMRPPLFPTLHETLNCTVHVISCNEPHPAGYCRLSIP